MHYLKNKKILFSLFIIFILGIAIDKYNRELKIYNEMNIELNENIIEYGDDFVIDNLIKESNCDYIAIGEIDTNKVGDYELIFKLEKEEKIYKNIVKKEIKEIIHVVDSKPPIISLYKDSVVVYLGNEFDYFDNIESVIDEVDGEIDKDNIEITSDADLNSVGEYIVNIKAYDLNNLESNAQYILYVKNKILSTGESYDYIYNYLSNNFGYNKAAICGILANIRYESGFNALAGDYYYGLCQWGGGRKENLINWCNNNGLDYDSIDGQLEFMNYELSTSYINVKNYLLSLEDSPDSAKDAAIYFCQNYEGAYSFSGRDDLALSYYLE